MKFPLVEGSPPTLRSQMPLNSTVVTGQASFDVVHLLTRALVACAMSCVLPSTVYEWSQVPFLPSTDPSKASSRVPPPVSMRWRHAVPNTPHFGAARAAVENNN